MGRKNKRKKLHYRALPEVEVERQTEVHPKRMEIWVADLPKVQHSHVQGGARPVVIVSNDVGNTYGRTVTVLPLTTKMKKTDLPTHTILTDTGTLSQALAEQIITIDTWRLRRDIGVCGCPEKIEEIMKAQLGLNQETEEISL